jgi:small subunit ribosomal protein S4
MSRYRGPRIKIVRRLGLLPGFTNKFSDSHIKSKKKNLKKKKDHRERLEEKQRLRFHYGITERQLLNYVRLARKAKGSTGQILLQLLEMRLDNIVYRLGFSQTIPAARQLVNHGHVLVNNRVVNIPSYRCKPQDFITIKNKSKSRNLAQRTLNHIQEQKIANHLYLNAKEYKGEVKQIVNREWIGVQVNELLIVEYYSRQA